MKSFTFIALCFVFIHVHGQAWLPHTISSTVPKANGSIAYDVDGDGYMDVVSLSIDGDFEIRWFKNIDGEGTFDAGTVIANDPALYLSFEFVDLNGDGQEDILYLENNPREVRWMERLSPAGEFTPSELIFANSNGFIKQVTPADLDNDGDLDLITIFADTFEDRISWFENTDGLGTWSSEVIIINGLAEAFGPLLVDINSDGRLDLLTCDEGIGFGASSIVWYEQLIDGTFDEQIVIYQYPFFVSDWTSIHNIDFVDINSDNKKDIMVTAHHDDFGTFYHWYENVDEEGTFGEQQSITSIGGPYEFYDLDGDGDLDILASNRNLDKVYWLQNLDGQGTYSDHLIISTDLAFPKDTDAADFNGDGRLDVVAAGLQDNSITWFENTGNLGISNIEPLITAFYPNPTFDVVSIKSHKEITAIEVYNHQAQLLFVAKNTNQIDLSELASGIYLIKVFGDGGSSENLQILKL